MSQKYVGCKAFRVVTRDRRCGCTVLGRRMEQVRVGGGEIWGGAYGNKAGFTLIELMVVIIILGLLAAIVMPRIVGETDKARYGAGQAQMRILEDALKRYKLDNGVFPSTEQGLEALVRQADRAVSCRVAGRRGAIWTSRKSPEIRGGMRMSILHLVSIAPITISNRSARTAWKAAMATMRISKAGVYHDERGFTMVELGMVLLVLGIVMATVMPRFTGTLERQHLRSTINVHTRHGALPAGARGADETYLPSDV